MDDSNYSIPDEDLPFASMAIPLLQQSILQKFPDSGLWAILPFASRHVEQAINFLTRRLRLTESEALLLEFIRKVHFIHNEILDYNQLWAKFDREDGPVALSVLVNTSNLSNEWEYLPIDEHSIHTAPMSEGDKQRIAHDLGEAESHEFLVFVTDPYLNSQHQEIFSMQLDSVIPTEENLELQKQVIPVMNQLFTGYEDTDDRSMFDDSPQISQLVDIDNGDLLRVAYNSVVSGLGITSFMHDFNIFMSKIWRLKRYPIWESFDEKYRGEEQASMALFRFTDLPEFEQFQGTFGPIIHLTIPLAEEELLRLNAELLEDEEQNEVTHYHIRMYQRMIDFLKEKDDAGLHYWFTDEAMTAKHGYPFAHFCTIPE
jgi:hypothetical protein